MDMTIYNSRKSFKLRLFVSDILKWISLWESVNLSVDPRVYQFLENVCELDDVEI